MCGWVEGGWVWRWGGVGVCEWCECGSVSVGCEGGGWECVGECVCECVRSVGVCVCVVCECVCECVCACEVSVCVRCGVC